MTYEIPGAVARRFQDRWQRADRSLVRVPGAGIEAFIPFKVNAVVNSKAPVWSRHLVEFQLQQERFLQHYHRRSNIETVFHMMKACFGAW